MMELCRADTELKYLRCDLHQSHVLYMTFNPDMCLYITLFQMAFERSRSKYIGLKVMCLDNRGIKMDIRLLKKLVSVTLFCKG